MESEKLSFVFENYLTLARKFCDSCESALIGDQRQFLSQIQGLLLEIYLLGRLLPETSASAMDVYSFFEIDGKEVQGMFAEKIPFSYYWQTLDSFSSNESPLGLGDLLDDLGDIYMDLKRSILLYASNQGGAKQEAYWKFKFDFDHHLADHTMNAMKAIHDFMGKDGYNGW